MPESAVPTAIFNSRPRIWKPQPLTNRRSFVSCVVIFAMLSPTFAQTKPAVSGFVLQDGTPVKLRINRTISSADARTGDEVDFEVLEELRVNGVLVIAKGGTAMGTVTQAEPKRRMARGGKLDITIDSVRLVDTEKAALRAVKEGKGGGPAGAMTAGIVAASLIVWPAAPLFLLMHGKDITIPKDTEITAYTSGDMPLDASKFQPGSTASGSNSIASAPSGQEKNSTILQITSVPAKADIEIDGNFVGDTPSQLELSAGDHIVRLTKNGYAAWEKKLHTTAGLISINAEMESQAKTALLTH